MKKLIILAALALGACGGRVTMPPPEPIIRTVEVKVPVAVPCKALADMGDETAYPDAPAALQAAANIFDRVSLLLQGRVLRDARLAEYQAAKRSC